MKLISLKAQRYRSLREETIPIRDLNLFIGANASGKSTILDALRFLHEGVRERDFTPPVASRGGIVHLAWKGEDAWEIDLIVQIEEDSRTYEWSVRLRPKGHEFSVREEVHELSADRAPKHLLSA